MKNFISLVVASVLVLTSFHAFGHEPEKNIECKVDSKKATIVDERIYFNVLISLETTDCLYSLVRHNPDGSIESIGIKEGIKNPNKLNLLYSFKDQLKPNVDTEYALYRISAESEVIAKWKYVDSTNKIIEDNSDNRICKAE